MFANEPGEWHSVQVSRANLEVAQLINPLWLAGTYFSSFSYILAMWCTYQISVICGALLAFVLVCVVPLRKVRASYLEREEVWDLSLNVAIQLFDISVATASAKHSEASDVQENAIWRLEKTTEPNHRAFSIEQNYKGSYGTQRIVHTAAFKENDEKTIVQFGCYISRKDKETPTLTVSMLTMLNEFTTELQEKLIQRNAINYRTTLYSPQFIVLSSAQLEVITKWYRQWTEQLCSVFKVKKLKLIWALFFVWYVLIVVPAALYDIDKQTLWYALTTDLTPILLAPSILFYAIESQRTTLKNIYKFVVPISFLCEIVNIAGNFIHNSDSQAIDSFHFALLMIQIELLLVIPAMYAGYQFAFKKTHAEPPNLEPGQPDNTPP